MPGSGVWAGHLAKVQVTIPVGRVCQAVAGFGAVTQAVGRAVPSCLLSGKGAVPAQPPGLPPLPGSNCKAVGPVSPAHSRSGQYVAGRCPLPLRIRVTIAVSPGRPAPSSTSTTIAAPLPLRLRTEHLLPVPGKVRPVPWLQAVHPQIGRKAEQLLCCHVELR